jgi:hypothetical protein
MKQLFSLLYVRKWSGNIEFKCIFYPILEVCICILKYVTCTRFCNKLNFIVEWLTLLTFRFLPLSTLQWFWRYYTSDRINNILIMSLTLSVHTEYTYSTASHASCPDGVLILCDFHKVLKWEPARGILKFKWLPDRYTNTILFMIIFNE